MEIFFVCIVAVSVVFIFCFGWELSKRIAHNLFRPLTKRIYGAHTNVENVITVDPTTQQSNKTKVILSEEEKKVRKDWLWSLLTYHLGPVVIFGAYFNILNYFDEFSANIVFTDVMKEVIKSAISLAIYFYFTYVKFGTKWIKCAMICLPIECALEIIGSIVVLFDRQDLTLISTCHLSFQCLFMAFLTAYFWIHCKRLYKLNRAIKKRKIEKEDSELELLSV